MFTGIVFHELIDNTTLSLIDALAGVPYRTSGNDAYVPPDFNQVIMANYFGSTLGLRAQFEAPSMVLKGAHEIKPLDLAILPSSDFPIEKFIDTPIVLDVGEAINAKESNSTGVTPRTVISLWLSDGDTAPVKNPDMITIRATATITAVANTWTNGQITLDRDLRVGEYALVGARVEGTTINCCRFIPANSNARPMVLGRATGGNLEDGIFRRGNLGTWLTFRHDTPPAIEIFCTSADTAQTLTLDIVRL